MKTASATAAAITGTVAALSDRELLAQTGNLARVERHLQGAIIDHLAEIEARSLFLRRGFASLFEYAVRELGYSDAAAGRRIAAMRLCADNPQTRERLRDGSLSLSAAAELQWAFDRQRRRVPAATTPAVAALPTEPPLVLDAVGRQKLVEEAAGRPPRPEPAAPAHRQSTGSRACARRANSGGGAGPPDRFAAEADGPAGSQRHFDGTDPAGLRRPRRCGAEVTRFGPCDSGGGEARGLATRPRTLSLRRSASRTALYLTASAADRPRPALRARRRLRSGQFEASLPCPSPPPPP